MNFFALLCGWVLLEVCCCFQFKSVTVAANPYTINTLSTYTIKAQRQYTSLIQQTAWDTELVPSGANLTIVLPGEFTLDGSEQCQSLKFGASVISGWTCVIEPADNQIVFTNSISSETAVSDIEVVASEILNPAPVLTTSPFTLKIGNDNSAYDPFSSVTLQPGVLTSVDITFDPPIVNTSGDMHFSLIPTNQLPVDCVLVVEFESLVWTEDADRNHQLPLGQVSCSGYGDNINHNITCVGNTNTRTVTLSDVTSSSTTETIHFSINGLFSPPTTGPTDKISITTYTGDGSTLDQTDNGIVSELVGQSLDDLSIATTVSPLEVNDDTGLVFTWSLTDTITSDDYFLIHFPIGSVITFSVHISTFGSLSHQYETDTGILQLEQLAISKVYTAGNPGNITFLTYQAPKSNQPITILFQVMRNGYEKMEGSVSLVASPRSYGMVATAGDLVAYAETNYVLEIQLEDQLASNGYIVVEVPEEVEVGGIGVSIVGSEVNSFPTVEITNNTLTIKDLNTSSSSIAPQTLTITISSLRQPPAAVTISPFSLTFYYDADNYMVAVGTQTNTISTIPDPIKQLSISASTSITYTSINITLSFTVSMPFLKSSIIIITVPTQFTFSNISTCLLSSYSISECSVSADEITITTDEDIDMDSIIEVKVGPMMSPISTAPSSEWLVVLTNNVNDIMQETNSNTTGNTISMQQPNTITEITYTTQSSRNDDTTTYQIVFTNPTPMYADNTYIFLTLPPELIITNITSITSPSSTFSIVQANNETEITITHNSPEQTPAHYTITVTNIQNPPSLEPTSLPISIQTQTLDGSIYAVGTDDSNIVNLVPGEFVQMEWQFTTQELLQYTNLTLSLQMRNNLEDGYLQLVLADDLDVDASFDCYSDAVELACTVSKVDGITTITIIPTSNIQQILNLILINLLTPDTYKATYSFSTVSTYSSSSYKMDQSNNKIRFSLACDFPCKTCSSTTSACTTCYSINITTQIYLLEEKCVGDCGVGYWQNGVQCEACDEICLECEGGSSLCTNCDSNGTEEYLFNSTCLGECPEYFYEDHVQIPYLCTPCVGPCLDCASESECTSCQDGFWFVGYSGQCLSQCPSLITVSNPDTKQCDNCSVECLTCEGTINTCISCQSPSVLFNHTCVDECIPGWIESDGQCIQCALECKECFGVIDNCTLCTSAYPYAYTQSTTTCVEECPVMYYVGGDECLFCGDLNIGCEDCYGVDNCSSCDAGLVLLDYQCLNSTPDGYVNISGVAVACEGDCLTCEGTVTNCTSCKTFNLLGNQCLQNCPTGMIPINQLCTDCSYPCLTCTNTVTQCTSCYLNSSLFLSEPTYQCTDNCPTYTYPNSTTLICEACIDPCLDCTSQYDCRSCVEGYYLYQNASTCLDECPVGWVGVVDECVLCQSPCEKCFELPTQCTDCVSGYFYNQQTDECLDVCPSGTIADNIHMKCIQCQSPCRTCENTTSSCLSCVRSTYLHLSVCLDACPDGYYNQSNTCVECSDCATCSSAVICLSCTYPQVLYSQQCLSACPSSHAILNDNNQCVACSKRIPNCSECNRTGQCFSCFSPSIFFNNQCYDECPEGYKYSNIEKNCVEENDTVVEVEEELEETLTSSSLVPMPFTIGFAIIFIACFVSKLQNSATYLVGSLYAFVGLLEVGSLGLLGWKYYEGGKYENVNLFLLVGSAGLIYLLNFLSLAIQTPLLLLDKRLSSWSNNSCNKASFTIFTICSFLLCYKLKLIIFTRLFSFHCLKAQLQNIQKFRMFNILSFIGIIHQTVVIYASIITLMTLQTTDTLFLLFIDAIIIAFLGIILSLVSGHKHEDFFVEEVQGGYLLNKKVLGEGEQLSREALKPYEFFDEEVNADFVVKSIIQEEEQFDSSSEDIQSAIRKKQEQIQTLKKEKQQLQNKEKIINDTDTFSKNSEQQQQIQVPQIPLNIEKIMKVHTEQHSVEQEEIKTNTMKQISEQKDRIKKNSIQNQANTRYKNQESVNKPEKSSQIDDLSSSKQGSYEQINDGPIDIKNPLSASRSSFNQSLNNTLRHSKSKIPGVDMSSPPRHPKQFSPSQKKMTSKEEENSSQKNEQTVKPLYDKQQPLKNIFDQELQEDSDHQKTYRINKAKPMKKQYPDTEILKQFEAESQREKQSEGFDSGLDESQPEKDQPINHKPLESSFSKFDSMSKARSAVMVDILENVRQLKSPSILKVQKDKSKAMETKSEPPEKSSPIKIKQIKKNVEKMSPMTSELEENHEKYPIKEQQIQQQAQRTAKLPIKSVEENQKKTSEKEKTKDRKSESQKYSPKKNDNKIHDQITEQKRKVRSPSEKKISEEKILNISGEKNKQTAIKSTQKAKNRQLNQEKTSYPREELQKIFQQRQKKLTSKFKPGKSDASSTFKQFNPQIPSARSISSNKNKFYYAGLRQVEKHEGSKKRQQIVQRKNLDNSEVQQNSERIGTAFNPERSFGEKQRSLLNISPQKRFSSKDSKGTSFVQLNQAEFKDPSSFELNSSNATDNIPSSTLVFQPAIPIQKPSTSQAKRSGARRFMNAYRPHQKIEQQFRQRSSSNSSNQENSELQGSNKKKSPYSILNTRKRQTSSEKDYVYEQLKNQYMKHVKNENVVAQKEEIDWQNRQEKNHKELSIEGSLKIRQLERIYLQRNK